MGSAKKNVDLYNLWGYKENELAYRAERTKIQETELHLEEASKIVCHSHHLRGSLFLTMNEAIEKKYSCFHKKRHW